jgi:hypothetical protein
VLDGRFPSQGLRSCCSLHNGMFEDTAHRRDSRINLSGSRIYEPCISLRYRADFVETRVKIHCVQHGVNQRAEPATAWSLDVGT